MSLRALALAGLVAFAAAAQGCIGGPHPLPPDNGVVTTNPQTSGTATASNPTTPTLGVAGASATATPPAAMSAGGNTGTPATQPPPPNDSSPMPASPGAGAAGAGALTPTGSSTPPVTNTGSAGAGGGAATQPEVCDGPTGTLSASETAPSTLLLVLDRSVDMASDFEGAPRWQRSSEALMHTLTPRGNALTIGALLYPSAAARTCAAADWLCALQGPTMCQVNPMASADQVQFQPASEALGTLLGPDGLYAPVTAAGVPLGESLQRADTALAAQPASTRTSVVIVASGMPSCGWDSARASSIVARWKSERGVRTYVVALPGSPGASSDAFAALAEAGGTGDVRAPQSVGALEATLQSVVFDSLSSCSLELDPPAADPSAVQVRVTAMGAEQSLPRTSASGETLWTLSPDGKAVTLLGTACEAAKGGAYDAIRVVLGCARP
jgi:hypothetical protein